MRRRFAGDSVHADTGPLADNVPKQGGNILRENPLNKAYKSGSGSDPL